MLAALAQISSERPIFEVLLRRLFSKLDIVLSCIFSSFLAYLATTDSITYPHAILGTIFLVIKKKSQSQDRDLPSYIETLVATLLNKIIVPAVIPGPRTSILCNHEIIHVVGLIVNIVVRPADAPSQSSFFVELFKLFVNGEPSLLIISSTRDEIAGKFRPFDTEGEGPQAETVGIFVSAIAAARKEVPPPYIQLTLGCPSSDGY
jgi:DNA repair/transcription protein MET18/MMS19